MSRFELALCRADRDAERIAKAKYHEVVMLRARIYRATPEYQALQEALLRREETDQLFLAAQNTWQWKAYMRKLAQMRKYELAQRKLFAMEYFGEK